MKRLCIVGLAMLAAFAAVRPAAGQAADVSKSMADIAEKAKSCLAVLSYTVTIQTGSRTLSGLAICVDPNGLFVTLAVDSRLRPEMLKDLEMTLPGPEGKKVKAKLLYMDVLSGVSFVEASPGEKWSAVQFAKSANLTAGQPVFSVGLFGDAGNTPYLGMGYVSATLRGPDLLVYVTGGNLATPGSPVFTADGRAVGIVGRQLNLSFTQIPVNQQGQMAQFSVQSRHETSFFTPVDEFSHVLMGRIPRDGQVSRPPWVGVNRFEMVKDITAEVLKLDANFPSIIVTEVVPDQPAAKAGLQERDIIVAVNKEKIERLANDDLTVNNFVNKLMRMPIGGKVTLTVTRDRKQQDFVVNLEPMPTRPDEAKRSVNLLVGVEVREKVMLDFFLDKGPTKDVQGMIVLGVGKDSPAEKAGLLANDVLISINGKTLTAKDKLSTDLFKEIVDEHILKNRTADMVVVYQRSTQPSQAIIKIPAPPSTAPAKP